MYHARVIDSPIGPLQLLGDAQGLARIAFAGEHMRSVSSEPCDARTRKLLERAATQLDAYFAGRRKRFDLPLNAAGTAFQHQVWEALVAIPWGETRSYAEVARAIGRENAVRAVGAANGRNPLPLVVPCHRVIGSDGSLTGFAGGLDLKRQLLELEGIRLPLQQQERLC
jgi:methylated-DNA-[protein]-cysteine S-methyltransferase